MELENIEMFIWKVTLIIMFRIIEVKKYRSLYFSAIKISFN